jgi:hypothetical protein
MSDSPLSLQMSQTTGSGAQSNSMIDSRDIPIQFNRNASYTHGSEKIDARGVHEP